jgi:hypothetical protein
MPIALWTGNSVQHKADAEDRAGKSEHGYLYRVEWCRQAQMPELKAYPILKVTTRGWRIQIVTFGWFGRRESKMVFKDAARAFAKPTVAEAVENYVARKTYYRDCLKHRLTEATAMIEAIHKPEVKREFEYFLDEEPLRPGPYWERKHQLSMSLEDELV